MEPERTIRPSTRRGVPPPQGPRGVNPNPPKARVLVVESMHHIGPTGRTISHVAKFMRWLASEEQCYQRRFKVGEAWTDLDTGWFQPDQVLMVGIAMERPLHAVIPTPEQAKAEKAVEVHVRCGTSAEGYWTIRPGESFRGTPSGPVQLRSTKGEVWVNVSVVPL